MRILFLVKSNNESYGICKGLQNSALFLSNALNLMGFFAEVSTVIDANGIDKEVDRFKPDLVVIEAYWVTPQKLKELLVIYKHKLPKTHWVVRSHSKITFCSEEGQIMEWSYGYKTLSDRYNFKLSGNHQNFVEDIDTILDYKIDYLPNIYQPGYSIYNNHIHHHETINIGCFGAIRPLKNQLLSSVAAIRFANEINHTLNFHINTGRIETRGEQVLKNLRALFYNHAKHSLVEHGWLSHKDFLSLVSKMDLSMQVSYTESFNIVTADAVQCRVPVVVSDEIEWINKRFKASCGSIDDMVKKMHKAYNYPDWAASINTKSLDCYNKNATNVWFNYLTKLGLSQD